MTETGAQQRTLLTQDPPMKHRAAVSELRNQIGAFVREPEAVSETSLRLGVHAIVDALRSLGWAPERVIVTVKEIAFEAGLKTSRSTGTVITPTLHDVLMRQLVCWAIDRYYCETRWTSLTVT